MKVTLTDGRSFDLGDMASLTNVEAMALERVTGWDIDVLQTKMQAGSALALTAFIWVMAKRQEPTLRFDDVEFDMTQLVLDEAAPDPTPAAEPG